MPEPQNPDERLKGALLIAVAAICLRGEPIANTPKVIATIHDSIKLPRRPPAILLSFPRCKEALR